MQMAKLSEIHRRMKLADQVKRPKRPSGAQVAAMRAERSAGAKSNVTVGVKRKAKKRGKKSTPLMYMSRREEGELLKRYQRWQRVQDIRMKIVAELGCVATPEVMAQWLELPGGVAALEQIEGLGHEAQERLRAKHLNLIRQAAWRHRGEGMPVDELVTVRVCVLLHMSLRLVP
jgi:DNA-directed RNA polymerase sigma subunit (sigma70/sigma32)